jgi:hypothetical protein
MALPGDATGQEVKTGTERELQSNGEVSMAVARVTTLTASSPQSFDDATKQALDRANRTLRGVTGAEVKAQKVKVDQGRIQEYRVTLDVTFILDE